MEDALAQKYDRIQQFATRTRKRGPVTLLRRILTKESHWAPFTGLVMLDWLGPSSASLARLERVKANVHNITPTLSTNLRPSSASRPHKIYTDLDTAPPLASKSLHSTATAWGSDASIPELIKQQGERQTQRQASAKGPRRPWSGRKVPPSPTLPHAGEGENESQRKLNALMSVKGSRYDPKSRPPSGRGARQTTGTALAELMVGLEDLSKQDVDNMLEGFIWNQPSPGRHELARLSAMYGDHPSLIAPPPAPHGSPIPDQEILQENEDGERVESMNDNQESEVNNQPTPYKEIQVKQPAAPQLLRRPTPEPVRLSMTIPGMEEDSSEPEDDFIYSERSQEGSPDAKHPRDLELQSVTSEVLSQLDEPLDGPSPHPHRDQPTPLTAEGQVRVVTKSSPATKDGGEGGVAKDASSPEKDLQSKLRSRHSVHIAEERNVTIDITPRDVLQPFVPRPPIRKRRPQSAVTATRSQNLETAPNTLGSKAPNSSTGSLAASRPKSARPRVARMPTVGIEYGDDSETPEVPVTQSEMHPVSNTRSDVETMMSRMALSDEETEECRSSSVTRQVSQSSFKKNYYQLSRETSVPTQAALLTTKTLQFGDQGPLEEKSVSVIKQASEPFRSALLRQDRKREGLRGRAGSTSDDDTTHRTHSAIRRPTKPATTVGTAAPPRPESRMGHKQGDTDISTTPGEAEHVEKPEAGTETKPSPASTRPVSAPSTGKRRSAETTTGRKSPSRIGRRPHSAKPPSGSDGSKLCSKSSTAVMASPKKRAVDYKRNREAVRALRDGSLHKEKKYTKQVVAVEDPKPIIRRPRKPASESSEEDEPLVVPLSAQEQEMEDMHQKLLERGVNVSAQTLARGLLPPTQRGYDDCMAELPEKSSLGLLNEPEAWLGKLFRKYKLAEKALAIANDRMAVQADLEAKQAAKGPAKKKKKAGKRKVKHKRSSTVM